MHFAVLGSLRAEDQDGAEIHIGGPARRTLLAALLCRAGRPVAAEVLISDLWGVVPPRSAAKTLQSHVVRLRSDLARGSGPGTNSVVRTTSAGYQLDLDLASTDAAMFERAVGAARAAERAEPDAAVTLLQEALGLWRDDAYLDFGDASFAVAERLRLAELRSDSYALYFDVQLRLGRHRELIAPMRAQVAAEPYRERGWELLILALYRDGRQAEALLMYRKVSDLLAAELGVDPGPALRGLERAILIQDPTLLATASSAASTEMAAPRGGDTCPYRGLDGYRETDAALFVGRELLSAQLAGLIADDGLVLVTGPSGSGKSSLVRAGLLPALRSGALPGSAAWLTAVVPPAGVPDAAAGEVLDLLVVDQAEELFTVLDDAGRTRAAAGLAWHLERGTRTVLVVRGDFVGRLAELGDRVASARSTLLVRPLRTDELRRVLEEPAARRGVAVAPPLIEAVLDEMGERAAALPLLSVALVRAWQRHTGDRLTLADYRAGGGVVGALEAAAEDAWGALSPDASEAGRRVLLRLVSRQADGWVRRPLPTAALTRAGAGAEAEAVALLGERRLLTIGTERVELVHDALLTRWPRLRAWLDAREIVAQLLEHLAVAAHEWHSTDADVDLYRGARLEAASDWAEEHPHDLGRVERDFLDASQRAAASELDRQRDRADREAAGRRRLRVLVGALVAVLILAVAGGIVALHARATARSAALRAQAAALSADARRLAAESGSAPDLRTALLLAVGAYRLQDSPVTRGALLTAIESGGAANWRISTAERVQWLGSNAAGTIVWAGDDQQMITRYDLRTRRRLGAFPERAGRAQAVSPNGRLLVTSGQVGPDDDAGAGRVVVLDATTGAVLRILPTRTTDGAPGWRTVAFTGDGRWLAMIAASPSGRTGSDDVAVYDANDLRRAPRLLDLHAPVDGLAAGRDTIAATTVRGDVVVAGATDLRPVARARRPDVARSGTAVSGPDLALAPDGSHVAIVSTTGSVLLLRTDQLSGGPVALALDRDFWQVPAFSPDGRRLAVGGSGGAVDVLDVRTGRNAVHLAGDSGSVNGVTWPGTSDSAGLLTGGLDSQIVSWKLSARPRMLRLTGPTLPTGPALVAGGDLVGVAAGADGPGSRLRLLLARLGAESGNTYPLGLTDHDYLNNVDPDEVGHYAVVAIASDDGGGRCLLFDLHQHRVVRSVALHSGYGSCAISPDGRTVVAGAGDRRVMRYSVPGLRPVGSDEVTLSGPNASRVKVVPFAFSPGGKVILMLVDPGAAALPAPAPATHAVTEAAPTHQGLLELDPATGHTLGQLALGAEDSPFAMAWTADRRRAVLSTSGGRLYLIDTVDWRVLRSAPSAEGDALSASFSPDGSTIVSGGTDGTLGFFDAHTLQRIGAPVRVAGNGWWVADYAAHGQYVTGLAPVANGQRLFRFPADPGIWAHVACSIAGSSLTPAEWQRYVGDRPYVRTC